LLFVAAAFAGLFLGGGPRAEAQTLMPIPLQGDVERGEKIAMTCSGCHAVPSAHNAYPAYHVPKLGGQNADYLEVALQAYRGGQRAHQTMQAQASTLTDQDIADVVAFFASQESDPKRGRVRVSSAVYAKGEELAKTCEQCHGVGGVSQTLQWPSLAGQHRSYLEETLHQYKTGERGQTVMDPLMAPLSDEDIEALAAFFAAQPWLYTLDR
jgi:cytochrome c553